MVQSSGKTDVGMSKRRQHCGGVEGCRERESNLDAHPPFAPMSLGWKERGCEN